MVVDSIKIKSLMETLDNILLKDRIIIIIFYIKLA
jgi:hypothetical protein